MPEIIYRIDVNRLSIQITRQVNQPNSASAGKEECLTLALACPIAQEQETECQAGERESRPRENWEKPRLGLAKVVYAIDI